MALHCVEQKEEGVGWAGAGGGSLWSFVFSAAVLLQHKDGAKFLNIAHLALLCFIVSGVTVSAFTGDGLTPVNASVELPQCEQVSC